MPLYELVCIARATANTFKKTAVANARSAVSSTLDRTFTDESSQTATAMPLDPTRSLIKQSALQVLDRQGVVRRFELLDENKVLPYRMKRHQEIFDKGDYWSMQFYSSPKVMRELSKALDFDERVIRHTMIKLGESLSEITSYRAPEKLL